MAQNDNIQLFEDKRIRTAWDEEKEEWYFSVVDVVAVLTDQPDYQAARNYWKVTKKRLKDEGNETVTACNQLKMTASDGKKRLTDVADTEQLLRIIQSIPSPKAEPFKLWLAKVGYERMQEMADPAQALDRARQTWQQQGRSDKEAKGLTSYILCDHMREPELIFTALAELSTRQIAESVEALGLSENAEAGRKGGGIARKARQELEQKTGRQVISGESFLPPKTATRRIKAREGGE